MPRLFVAVRTAPDVADRLCQAQAELAPLLSDVRWTKRESLHLTLKFMSHVDDGKVDEIQKALQAAFSPLPRFTISCRGLGVFPDIRRPKVIWAGLEGGALAALAETAEAALAPLGFPREARGFKPHLTIGRWREGARGGDRLRAELERWRHRDFGASAVDDAVLFQSVLKRTGAEYTPLKIFPLRKD
ncbi:MAG TPA: RNA 2',3'-cyclic phosphodiesterase [Candidatus Binatia bacterium]|jgi:2'-5' RNA ligase|nr:RNA 2',3'-cyclic phosphodiesterase [Candidatus Binatia bacterium]